MGERRGLKTVSWAQNIFTLATGPALFDANAPNIPT